MSGRTMTLGDAAYLLVLGIAVPVTVIHWTLGLYHLAFLAGLLVVVGLVHATTGWVPGFAGASRRSPAATPEIYWPAEGRRLERAAPSWGALASLAPRGELELMERVAAPPAPLLIRVVAASGLCPLGFRPGDTWVVDETGYLSSPLCLPAAMSLTPLLQSPEGNGNGHPVSCHCPLGQRDVVFAAARRN